jgi:LPS O-antigen subunit length determinant protein (WzzB/FepE family)
MNIPDEIDYKNHIQNLWKIKTKILLLSSSFTIAICLATYVYFPRYYECSTLFYISDSLYSKTPNTLNILLNNSSGASLEAILEEIHNSEDFKNILKKEIAKKYKLQFEHELSAAIKNKTINDLEKNQTIFILKKIKWENKTKLTYRHKLCILSSKARTPELAYESVSIMLNLFKTYNTTLELSSTQNLFLFIDPPTVPLKPTPINFILLAFLTETLSILLICLIQIIKVQFSKPSDII